MTHQQEICQPKFSQKSVVNTKRNLKTFSQQIVSKVLQTNSSVPYHFVRIPPLWTTSYLQLSIDSSWEARLYPFYRITETTETVATGSSATCFSDAALLGACYRQEGQQGLKACIASAGSLKWITSWGFCCGKKLDSQHSHSLWMP